MARKSKTKVKDTLTLEEAVENLTNIAEMPIDEKTPIGIIQNAKIVTNESDFSYKEVNWFFPEDPLGIIYGISPSFQAILDHFKKIYEEDKLDFSSEEVKKGIQSIMDLAAKAATSLTKYFALFQKDIDFKKNKVFVDLKDFYVNVLSSKFPHNLEGKIEWEEKYKKNQFRDILDFENTGLKDFDTILLDKEYELFFIRNDEAKAFISDDLIRNIRLYEYFDEAMEVTDDFYLKIERLKSKDLYFSSNQILKNLQKDIKNFYKQNLDRKINNLAKLINKCFMALLLAKNPKNVSKIDKKKSSSKYFKDFQLFLRKAFETKEYQSAITYAKDKKNNYLATLVHKLSKTLFYRLGGIKKEVLGYIHRMINRALKKDAAPNGETSFFNKMMYMDNSLRSYLKKYPNGPLIEILKELEENDENISFDPIIQGNIPEKLFDIILDKKEIALLHMPCPINQEVISKVSFNSEWIGFLREYKKEKKTHLIINIQNRQSTFESARAKALENLSNKVEFLDSLDVITLDYNSDFYHQINEFEKKCNYLEFKNDFLDSVYTKENSFFYHVEKYLSKKDFEILFNLIFETFFLSKKELSKQERKSFIDIFYMFFFLKILEKKEFSSVSFVSKDGIDGPSILNGSLFCFINLLNNGKLSKDDQEYFLWLVYANALLIRKRVVDSTFLIRKIELLSFINKSNKGLKIRKIFSKFFKSSFLYKLNINYPY